MMGKPTESENNMQKLNLRPLGCAALVLMVASAAASAQTDVSVSVGGVLKPGVYGRVEIGNRPPPPVIYPQPVIITQPVIVAQPVVVAAPAPLYMHVPPGHAKKWSKHCYKYNACGQPVYFVKNDYQAYYDEKGHGKHKNKHKNKHRDHDD
jgi:hypothetical protein